jgi:hypothetical protein
MHTGKKKVALQDGITLYGVGQKVIVRYIVFYMPEKNAFKIVVDGAKGRSGYFITRATHFFEGETLYKHGYRVYSYSYKLEKRYVSYLVKHTLYSKLQKVEAIVERLNKMSLEKMAELVKICDNMIEQASQVDRRIGKDIKRIK